MEILTCLSNYLHQLGITDDYFPKATEFSQNCSEIVNESKGKIMKHLRDGFYNAHNISTKLCDEISQNRSFENSHMHEREKCKIFAQCFVCIKENLQSGTSDDYELTQLHAITLNFTIIDFRLWRYFKVTSRVEELLNDAKALKNTQLKKTVNDCKAKGKCIVA